MQRSVKAAILGGIFVATLVLSGCTQEPQTTASAATTAPVLTTGMPTTTAPEATTAVPTTALPPTTQAPTVAPATTTAPTTVPPTTVPPTTVPPSTMPPETVPPTTVPPETAAPTAQVPDGQIDWSEIPGLLHPNVLRPELPFALMLNRVSLNTGTQWPTGFTYPGHPKELAWSSSDPSVAAVDQWGMITTIAPSTCVVSVTDGEQTLSLTLTVTPAETKPPELSEAEKDAAARAIAKEIAESIMNDPSFTTDLERIAKAARIVNEYVGKGSYSSSHPDYNKPYGTLVAGYSTCAGSTRATGLVLGYMGFTWSHFNENQWDHQWCIVYDVDGKTAFCDGSEYGIAGYDSREDQANWRYMTNSGELVYFTEYFG